MIQEAFGLWIDKVWAPYASKFERTLLILDVFSVHKTELSLNRLAELNTDVLFIPAGLTFYLQPCDVLLNKSLKSTLKSSWEEFMKINYEGDDSVTIS
jgi:hypothetical protein